MALALRVAFLRPSIRSPLLSLLDAAARRRAGSRSTHGSPAVGDIVKVAPIEELS